MEMRDRLIELMLECDEENEICDCFKERPRLKQAAEILADHILADGWIRLTCKVGDTLWLVPLNGTIESREVKSIDLEDLSYFLEFTNGHCYSDWKGEYDKYLFLTKEEAEAKMKEVEENGK